MSNKTFKDLPKIELICTDVDDTITHEGKLIPEAYDALWRAKRAGIKVIIVTGRPAGWADQMARFWPVDGVVAENGALFFYMDYSSKQPQMKKIFAMDPASLTESHKKLKLIEQEVLATVPGAKVAFDQSFRLFDLAIDFAEDVPFLGKDAIEKICSVYAKHGATYKVSSIHVNGWFGDFNKWDGIKLGYKTLYAKELEENLDYAIYCGDSPNDEPLFEKFKWSYGVANIKDFIDDFQYPPQIIGQREGGLGFVDLVNYLLDNI